MFVQYCKSCTANDDTTKNQIPRISGKRKTTRIYENLGNIQPILYKPSSATSQKWILMTSLMKPVTSQSPMPMKQKHHRERT